MDAGTKDEDLTAAGGQAADAGRAVEVVAPATSPLGRDADLPPAPALPRPVADRPRLIGEILEDMGVVGAHDALIGRYEQDFGNTQRLGEILVEQGLASPEQVEMAVSLQEAEREHWARRPPSLLAPAPATDLRSVEARRVGSARIRRLRNLQSVLMFVLAVVGVGTITWASGGSGGWYGLGALLLLGIKLTGSAIYRPVSGEVPTDTTVAVIVPFYNEDPEAFLRCLESIKAQTRRPDEIWVVDDGSADETCLDVARAALQDVPGAFLERLPANQGKRHAQGYAFLRTRCEILVTIDSDTVLDPAAIAEGLRPFADEKVQAVTGNVRALNHRTNLLTRLIDLRYANAFLFERAAYSTVGSVVCCCGSLSLLRAEVVRKHLDDFLHQTFLGIEVQYGDDRRLTQYALLEGKVLVQDTAVAYTAVPERLDHFRRQQLRWNKSFFRESVWAIRRFGPRHWAFWISLVEIVTWIAFSTSLIAAIYVRPVLTGEMIPWYYVAFAVVLAYARNVRYFGRPDASLAYQATTFALAPVYALLHVTLLTPMRLWALLTLRQRGWGTRNAVEVSITTS